ncbi:C2 domain-containing protein [Syncephalastrum racemosum]|uniref:C2 domain-containing protein n=1 Tax=Syncephalastrum racemosum TaxID=13706 RepID=A0A1X2HA97_SYNRA|nr:C2 domain-containing protein [Syncephalastrum racemosum]
MLSSHSAPKGTLTVRVLEADNLKKEDTFGTNDAYVEVWLDKEYKQRTETLKDTENPNWDQTFTFPIEEGSKHHELYLKVLDKDVTDSEKIGEGKTDFSSVLNEQGQEIDTWVKLPAHLHLSSHGQVHVKISFQPE